MHTSPPAPLSLASRRQRPVPGGARHLRDPRARARTARHVRLAQLDGHHRRRAGDRRHRQRAVPVRLDGGRVLDRRPGRRPLDLPVARRSRPHRQPDRPCSTPARRPRSSPTGSRSNGPPRDGAAARSHAVGQPRRVLRRRRSDARRRASADLRLAHDPRPVRLEDRRLLGGRTASRRSCPATSPSPTTSPTRCGGTASRSSPRW